jgi:asparagine synthase (glutamine-hydrolysing)
MKISEPEVTLRQMVNRISYRGPDSNGTWNESGIGLGHTRLSIIDLTPDGHQPMSSKSQRYIISYNGEVYNYKRLRRELVSLGVVFKGSSDTEVILAAIETWGLMEAVTRFVGMFAFALWDRMEHRLYLIRDRLGIKPLYYGNIDGVFIFVSDLKALSALPFFTQPINRDAVVQYLRYSYIPAPYSIYKNIQKLLPGHILTLGSGDNTVALDYEIKPYWSLTSVAEKGLDNPFDGTAEEAIGQLDILLRQSIKDEMVADVPLGVFLSGGIDSSVVTALMQDQSEIPVKTFTIGFHEEKQNEAKHANAIAHYLGTNHTELYINAAEAMDVIPKLPGIYDEPFSDSSQIPTYLVSQLARKHVTVTLSGDGGDELFYGYHRYNFTQNIWRKIEWLPFNVRSAFSRMLNSVVPARARRLQAITDILSLETADELYQRVISHWKNPQDVVIMPNKEPDLSGISIQKPVLSELSERMMFYDINGYLPNDILVKVDRASMGVSLEARVPLLDHRIVEFAWRLPMNLKQRGQQGKWILRNVLYRYVPRHFVDRPKHGFSIPISEWLCGPLREWAEELLDERKLREQGFFNPAPIRAKWSEQVKGKGQWHYYLWDILMFQSWLEHNVLNNNTSR